MKLLPILAVLLALRAAALAEPPPPPADEITRPLAPGGLPIALGDKPWTITGPAWQAVETQWRATMTFQPDGTIFHDDKPSEDRWLLVTRGGQYHLLIEWKNWPVEDLAMVSANEFYGTNGRSELRLTRRDPAPIPAAGAELGAAAVETRSWHQGEPPLKLIRQDEGFCALSSVTGHFNGWGESVKVYVAEDGYWYLGGNSHQNDVAASCIIVRYRPPAAGPRPIKSDG